MKYSYLSKRIFFILLFSFFALQAQKVTLINNTGEAVTIESGKTEMVITPNHKKELLSTDRFSISSPNDLNRFINIFLEPADEMNISIDSKNQLAYTGHHSSLHKYLNEQLNIDTFGNIILYENAGNRKNIGELKNSSELLLVAIMKKVNLKNIMISSEDTNSTKRLKNHIKYNWLTTIFSTISKKDKDFRKEVVNYYFKKYIETDIKKYSCNGSFPYTVLETLVKNKDLLEGELPIYPIIEHTEDDHINRYLPTGCQRQYFRNKYNYLEHINGPNKEYYKNVLKEKFNDD